MKIIQITNTYKGEVLEIVKSCVPDGFEIRTLSDNTETALLRSVGEADYILVSGRVRINASVLDKAVNLKMVQRTGVGLDSLDLSELNRRNIPVYVNQGVNARSVAEHSILLMLACLRRLPEICANTKQGRWIKQAQGVKTRELGRCNVGVIGMGHIGQTVASMLKSFGTRVCYYDLFRLPKEKEQELNLTYLPLEEIFEQADIITLHCPLTEETAGIICEETLAKMHDGAIVVNTARGKLVKEDDLLDALRSEKIGFAGLDVFETEPPRNMELLRHERVITTPHIAGVTYDSFYQMMHDAMRNIRLFDEGKIEEIEQNCLDLGKFVEG